MDDADHHGAPARDGGPGRHATPLSALRCFLFFPGSRPALHPKAVASGADGVCADLEDAVGPAGKDAAREAVAGLVEREAGEAGAGGHLLIVRVNAPDTDAGARDLEALAGLGALPDALLVPMVTGVASLERVREALGERAGELPLIALIETARGLATVDALGAVVAPEGALMLGGHDLSLELGARPGWEPLLHARSRIVHAAALAGVPALDMPLLELDDPEALRREARRARELGFSGKAAIHPDQVAPIQARFTPTDDEVEEARRVVEASGKAGGDAVLLDGKVVDGPVLEAARRTLARARERGHDG